MDTNLVKKKYMEIIYQISFTEIKISKDETSAVAK